MKSLYIIIIVAVVIILIVVCTVLFFHFRDQERMPGQVRDRTKKNAPKVIKSKDIKSFDTYFFYADEYGERFYHFNAVKKSNTEVELTLGPGDIEDVTHVGCEFLVSLQEIIDKHKLASDNGVYRVTAGLPVEPTSFLCKYESGESIYFYIDGDSYSEWMKDIYELFAIQFGGIGERKDFLSESEMTDFYFSHSGMGKDYIYSLDIRKRGEDYRLRADFFDPENSYNEVKPVWDTKEYSDVVEGIYNQVIRIYSENHIYMWNGFDVCNNDILDGTEFDMSIIFANGKSISACGSNSFPTGYNEVKDEIEKLMDEIIKIYHEKSK